MTLRCTLCGLQASAVKYVWRCRDPKANANKNKKKSLGRVASYRKHINAGLNYRASRPLGPIRCLEETMLPFVHACLLLECHMSLPCSNCCSRYFFRTVVSLVGVQFPVLIICWNFSLRPRLTHPRPLRPCPLRPCLPLPCLPRPCLPRPCRLRRPRPHPRTLHRRPRPLRPCPLRPWGIL